MYCLIIALSGIPGEELYLKKACKVNLNHTMEVCDNIHEHEEAQIATQKLVAGVQSHSAMLQSIPGIIFTMFAGPISDTYGRKPLILIPLFGYFILNFVYLVNSIWFHQLKVEFLLFECLQDLTGGSIVFFLATKCFIVDITNEENRTTRMAVLDAFYSVGYLAGLPLGNYIKKQFGYIYLFSLTLGLVICAMIYTALFIKDSYHLITEEQKKIFDEERDSNQLKCDRGVIKKVLDMTLSSFRTVFKKRPNKDRLWIIMLILIFIIPTILNNGYTIVGFMFYRLQYKISTEMYGHLISTWFVVNFFSQMVAVPFLSKTLKLRDTTIVVIALAPACVGFFGEAFFSDVWVLFVIWSVFYLLYFNIFTTTRSAMSKLMDPTEIGKAFAVLGVLESCLALVAQPLYGFMYQASLDIFAGLWMVVSVGWLLIALIIAISLHFGMKNSEQRIEKEQEINVD